MTLAELTALAPPSAAEETKELDTRFPDDLGKGLLEGSLVRVSGWVRLIATDPDCDYHIQLTPTNSGTDGTVIVEVPNPDVAYENSAELRDSATAVREFLKTNFSRGRSRREAVALSSAAPMSRSSGNSSSTPIICQTAISAGSAG